MFTRRHILQGAGLAAIALTLGACSEPSIPGEELRGTTDMLTLPLEDTPHVNDAASASFKIAWELMVADADVRAMNKAIAPSSLAVTLAMLAEGASGISQENLDDVFGLSGDDRSSAIGALRQGLAQYEDLPASVDANNPPDAPVVHQANRVMILDDAEIKQPFLDRLATYYGTGATRVARSEAKADLDSWANKHTAGLIEESAIDILPSTRLVTQDAILFAARWRNTFEYDDVPLQFTTGDGAGTVIKSLGDTFTVPFSAGADWEAIRLPYDDVLAMDVILPDRGTHPSELEFWNVEASVASLSSAMEQQVKVTMPPSDIKTEWKLLESLAGLGVDLGQMDGIFDGAFIEQFAQQVVLTVTAKGTVGAALTEAAAEESASEPAEIIDFIVDRPFIMRVLDTRTGWPFFVAIVNDPSVIPD